MMLSEELTSGDEWSLTLFLHRWNYYKESKAVIK